MPEIIFSEIFDIFFNIAKRKNFMQGTTVLKFTEDSWNEANFFYFIQNVLYKTNVTRVTKFLSVLEVFL